jgi:predicted RecA/RadA family phage recombinase
MVTGTLADSIQNARVLKLAHSAAVTAGDIIVSNGNVLIAVNDALINVENTYVYLGKAIIPKVAGTAFDPGDKCYWDAGAGNITKVTGGNTLCGICLEAVLAATTTIVVMLYPNHVLAPAASSVGIADAGSFTAQTNVETALQEIYQHIESIQAFMPIPLTSFRELAAGVFINAAGNGGILATDTTPILTMIADGDGMRLAWAAGNTDQIAAQMLMPPDMDLTADLVVHFLASKDANVNNACHIDGEAYFGESDVDCFPSVSAANLLVQAKGEYTANILAANLPASHVNNNMTLVVMPEAHAGDVVYLHGVWLEYKRKLLTA